MARWVKDPTLVKGMFYTFVFQDALRFRICGKDVRTDLMEVIENCKWAEFEAWLDSHHDLLIQQDEVEAPDSSVRSALCGEGAPFGGRNVSDEAISSASTPKLGSHEKK